MDRHLLDRRAGLRLRVGHLRLSVGHLRLRVLRLAVRHRRAVRRGAVAHRRAVRRRGTVAHLRNHVTSEGPLLSVTEGPLSALNHLRLRASLPPLPLPARRRNQRALVRKAQDRMHRRKLLRASCAWEGPRPSARSLPFHVQESPAAEADLIVADGRYWITHKPCFETLLATTHCIFE